MKKLILSILAYLLFSIGAYTQCFTPVWTEPSHDSMLIYVSMATLYGTNLQVGDEVGVFDREECVGVGVLTEELTGAPIYLVIEASRERRRQPGFRPRRTITYQFCIGGEVANPVVTPTYISNGPRFAENDSCVVELRAVNTDPTVTSIPDTVAFEDALYSSSITAVDLDGDELAYIGTDISGWLLFDVDTQVLSGTPGNAEVGYHSVTLSVFDGTVTLDTTFAIRVANVNDAPTFTFVPDTVALEDVLYTSAITARDIDIGDNLTFTAPLLPAWLNFNDTISVLSGTADTDAIGDHEVILRVNDGTVNVDTSFVIHVGKANDPPTITSTPVTEARPGVAYSYTITAVDIDGDTLTYTALVLPGWLTFNSSTHKLSATPGEEDIGDQHLTIRVSDGLLYTDQTFIITVDCGNHAPTFTSDPATSVVLGDSYVYNITAQDIDSDPLTYTASMLPDWLTFDSVIHMISGVPSSGNLGRHDVTLRVSDGTVSADQSFPIIVENVNSAPSFTSTPVTSALEGELYVYYTLADDVDGDDFIFSAPLLPDWLSFNVVTQVLYGTPDKEDAGDHNVRLRVSDGEGAEDQNFVITVVVQSGVGIDDFRSPDFMVVYPNPSNGRVIVELSRELEREIILEILDPMSKVLLQQEFPPYFLIKEEYNMSDRPAGIYFIRVYNDSHQTIRKLMIH